MARHKTDPAESPLAPIDLDRLKAASDEVDRAEAALEDSKAATKLCRETWEEAVAQLRKEVHDACGDGPLLPFGQEGEGGAEQDQTVEDRQASEG